MSIWIYGNIIKILFQRELHVLWNSKKLTVKIELYIYLYFTVK